MNKRINWTDNRGARCPLQCISGILVPSTGCFMISVKSDTPLFSDICRRSRLSFHVVIGHCCGFDFLKKKFQNFFRVRVRARNKPSLVFRLSLVLSMVKFKFSADIQLFGLKATSYGKPDLKNEFFRSDLPCEVVFRPRI